MSHFLFVDEFMKPQRGLFHVDYLEIRVYPFSDTAATQIVAPSQAISANFLENLILIQ